MSIRRSRRLWLGAAAAITAATAVAVPATLGRAASATPSLRLLTGVKHIEASRFEGDWHLFLPDTVFVAATDGNFEIDATRHDRKVGLEQVRRSGSKVTTLRQINPPEPATFRDGLTKFFSVVITDSTGKVVTSAHPSFCPVSDFDSQRVSVDSVANPTYPGSCGDQLTKSAVWGINNGWAVAPFFDLVASPDTMPDGQYTMTVAIAPTYAAALGVAPADRKVSLAMKLVTDTGGCADVCPGARSHARQAASRPHRLRATAGPYPVQPNGSGLPDLIALPAHGLATSHVKKSGKDFLDFAATIWNAGPGTFDVEGFRDGGRPTMKAKQFVFQGNRSVKSMNIGHFEFDNRVGHHHWHLEDVARYQLLDANGNRAVLSHKQSFCLAPTDPINMTEPHALWNPYSVGLESSCPTDQSIWLRETLPVGWGDTYVQHKGGQSFDITGLPNGRYEIEIQTNPFGNIHEITRKNNTALLAVELGGKPGARTVTSLGPVH